MKEVSRLAIYKKTVIISLDKDTWGIPQEAIERCRFYDSDETILRDLEGMEAVFFVVKSVKSFDFSLFYRILKRFPAIKLYLLGEIFLEPIFIKLKREKYINNYFLLPITFVEFEQILKNGALEFVQNNSYEARIRSLEELAYKDHLTSLKNRHYFTKAAEQILSLLDYGLDASLFVLDIDDFKKYNDLFGHLVGDEIIVDTANAIRSSFRPHDIVARVGGDEFAVLIWDFDMKNSIVPDGLERRSNKQQKLNATLVSGRIGHHITEIETKRGKLTVSGGMAKYPKAGKTIMELIDEADKALLVAKKQGKHTILFSDEI